MAVVNIPVVDFNCCGLGGPPINGIHPADQILDVARKFADAFKAQGFVYLRNHGMAQSLLDEIRSLSYDFFKLPVERKTRYSQRIEESNDGWVPVAGERFNPLSTPGDLKEVYHYTINSKAAWPAPDDADVPTFVEANDEFFKACIDLSLRVLQIVGIGFHPTDYGYFAKVHSNMGNYDKNRTRFKSLYYPPLLEEAKPGQVRLGTHSDYGSITLLFQDNIGGLEIQLRSGEYIPVTPVPGAVLVMAGDLMERWSADTIPAPKHRVLIPVEEFKLRNGRQSLAFFAHPDSDVTISCLDGSKKYEDINSFDALDYKFRSQFVH